MNKLIKKTLVASVLVMACAGCMNLASDRSEYKDEKSEKRQSDEMIKARKMMHIKQNGGM